MIDAKDRDGGDCCPDCLKAVEEGRRELEDIAEKLAAVDLTGLREKLRTRRPSAPVKPIIRHGEPFECRGLRGDVVDIVVESRHLFRGERLIACDTSGLEFGTKLRVFEIDDKTQFPLGVVDGYWTKDFRPSVLDCGILFKTIHPGQEYHLQVEFFADCEWHAELIGRRIDP